MRRLAAAAQMKKMDQTAIERDEISSLLLMERAASGIVEAVKLLWNERCVQSEREDLTEEHAGRERKAAVFAGPGNNGGDGVAAAGMLLQSGWNVKCFLVGSREKMTGDCLEMERRLQVCGGALEDYVPGDGDQMAWAMGADVIVDALFGIGLNAPLSDPGANAVKLINLSPAAVVSADIPSGIEADTGRILADAVRADVTVTFTMAKPGLYVGKGALYAGRVRIWDIGIPEKIIQSESYQTCLIQGDEVRRWLPPRPEDGHKGNFGKVMVVGGSVGYSGAPVLAADAAARTGAGLVTVLTPREVYPIVAAQCREVMVKPMSSRYKESLTVAQGADVVLIGPGLGRSPEGEGMALSLMNDLESPVIVDADGINALERHMDILRRRRGRVTVLTPHDGEFARLGGDVSHGDRLGAARAFARSQGCILVLKGHRTIVALPDGACFVNETGNSGMAKGGSGDVLGGILLALMGQGMPADRAAICAVYLHGMAGDMAAADKGEYGMLPSDMVEQLPYATKKLLN